MTLLVHLTPAKHVRRIRRAGIAAVSVGRSGETGVYCMPVLPSYTLTHQWLRELRRWGPRGFVAVHFRVPDDEEVTVGHYGRAPQRLTAAEASGLIRALDDPRGHEIFVPRAIARSELHRVRRVRQVTGWRYRPDAHGTPPCPYCIIPGEYGAARLRRRLLPDDDLDEA